ncbi:MAG: PQQ-binding-like beta-propeller repeat protein, partial [Planctomycetaceae bacterium]|nr:PQQ-binding-like beta-propeller repeat protein [Planctomycetaceae bacterium]
MQNSDSQPDSNSPLPDNHSGEVQPASGSQSSPGIMQQLKASRPLRILLALICSHLIAPYAAMRTIIRYSLDGQLEWRLAFLAIGAVVVGAVCVFGMFRSAEFSHRARLVGIGLVAWGLLAVAMMKVAVQSSLPFGWLVSLWSAGTLWIPWLVWTAAFFRLPGSVVTGLIVAGLAAGVADRIQVTGLTGDARVEIAVRKQRIPEVEVLAQAPADLVVGDILWPGYLGPERDGSATKLSINEDWDNHQPRELWRQNCGGGWSSFAVTSGMVFSQEQLQSEDCVTARSLETGQLLWVHSEQRPGFKSGMGGDGPRATPTLHSVSDDSQQTVLLAAGPTGMLTCLKAVSGEELWSVDMAQQFPGENLPHGNCASPLVINDLVIACPSAEHGPAMAAFHLQDGSLAWKVDSDWRSSYASPAAFHLSSDSQQPVQIVLHGGPGAFGVAADCGRLQWQFPWTNEWDNNATQPVQPTSTTHELVVATGYRGGVVRLKIPESSDANGTGSAVNQAAPVWENRRTLKTKFCNFTQFGGVLVGLDNGILVGVDLQTGTQLWKEGRY